MRVEKEAPDRFEALEVRLLGPLRVFRHGGSVALPPSRKVRGLMAYLALAPQPITRAQLCELLWEVPNDPRGELRWCLSKIRNVLDEPDGIRVVAKDDTVALDLAGVFVDAVEILRETASGVGNLPVGRLQALSDLFVGDFLEGAEIGHSPLFNGWVIGQRHRFRGVHAALLEHLVSNAADHTVFEHLEAWRRLAPFDRRVHEFVLRAMAAHGRIREGDEHLAATTKLFEAEGLDSAPLRQIWRTAREATDVRSVAATAKVLPPAPEPSPEHSTHRASIAVMPFVERSAAGDHGGLSAEGLVHDVITRLAKLRGLLVIAQGTVFALHERGIGWEEAGRTLNVDYVASGSFERRGGRVIVTIELAETKTARIVCTEVFERKLDDLFLVMDDIGNRIVALIAGEVEAMERNRAILKPPNSLNAWETYHRGLWHFYRFTRQDNERALRFFENAVQLDPTFARAHSGVSFAHFQNAFQGWAGREQEVDRAFEAAGQSLMADERDPAAHCAMGRALWLRHRFDQSIVELQKSVELSPNYVLGHYSMAFIQSQAGDPRAAIEASDLSRILSPFDPLLFAMLGSRAMALARLGDFTQAADWAVKAAARPNAHKHIMAIAAYTLALAGEREHAAPYLASIRKTLPRYGVEDFLAAMHFSPEDAALFREAAARHGLG
jgi:DNA-binding SARP family transcriptional activator/tetratricopeptide (TPR) repeat protein